MTDNIKPIRDGIAPSAGKQQFLDYVAQRWDDLAADGERPVCIVFALVAESGSAVGSYMTAPHIHDENTLHISRGVMVLNSDYNDWTRV